jgi:hypothetical protein
MRLRESFASPSIDRCWTNYRAFFVCRSISKVPLTKRYTNSHRGRWIVRDDRPFLMIRRGGYARVAMGASRRSSSTRSGEHRSSSSTPSSVQFVLDGMAAATSQAGADADSTVLRLSRPDSDLSCRTCVSFVFPEISKAPLYGPRWHRGGHRGRGAPFLHGVTPPHPTPL